MRRQEQDDLFAAWMRQHQNIILKVARSFAAAPAEQEDLAQEIRLMVWRAVPLFAGDSKVSSYIYRVALNRAISWQRRHRLRLAAVVDNAGIDLANVPAAAERPDPRLDLIYAEIRKLDAANRSIALLHLDQFSYQEIADTLGLTVGNVGVRLNRIRKTLIDNLKGAAT